VNKELEEWRDVKGYEGHYKVSNHGRVLSLVGWNGHKYIEREKMLSPYIQKTSKNYMRYLVVLRKFKLKRKYFKVHQLVASAFIPNPNNYKEINHKDSNPLNNHVRNLEWCTRRHNVKHSYESGFRKNFKVDKGVIVFLHNEKKMNMKEIANYLGTTHSVILNNARKYNIKIVTHSKYKIDLEEFKSDIKEMKNCDIARKYNCNPSLISIYKKRLKERGYIYAQ
jgi:hypothetical protein